TGYLIRNFGADFVIQAYGGDNTVKDPQLYRFMGDDQTNWSAFTKIHSVEAEAGGRMMELQTTTQSLDLDEEFTVLFCANDYEGGQSCSSVPVGKEPGALLVEQKRLKSVLDRDVQQIMEINFTAKAADVVVSDVVIEASGSVSVQTLQIPFTVPQGTTSTKIVMADMSSEPAGSLVTASVQSVLADKPTTIRGETVRAYIEEIPPGIKIDGFFDDWAAGNPDPVDMELGSNVDITEYDAVEGTSDVSFHLSVAGEMMQGTATPYVRMRSYPGEPGEPVSVPPIVESKVSGEDYVMIYIDSNSSDDLGEAFYGVKANTIVEIRGIYGVIKYKSLKNWINESWEEVAGVSAQNDMDEIEMSINLARVGTLDNPKIAFVTSNWNMMGDRSFQQTDWKTRSRAIYLVEDDQNETSTGPQTQRKVFYTGSYFFVFYRHATEDNITWEWSADGTDWTNDYEYAFESSEMYYVAVWYDQSGSRVYIIGDKNAGSRNVYLRSGTVTGNQISWDNESTVAISQTGTGPKLVSIAVDSESYVWIASEVRNSTGYNINVTRSINPEDISSFGPQTALDTNQSGSVAPIIVPLSNSDMYCVFSRNAVGGNTIKGSYYDDSSSTWSTAEDIVDDAYSIGFGGPSIVADDSDNVHLIYANTNFAVNYTKYTGSWSSTTILDDASNCSYPTVSLVLSDDLYAFWVNESEQISGKYSLDGGSTWSWMAWITPNTIAKRNLTSVYSYTNSWSVAWVWDMQSDKVYFERIPEFDVLLVPIVAVIIIPIILRRRH
ncbi:MAG: hypothetical protein KAW09_03385, partial [Thermoplasmata archaeon]|nr:hypothetical protein [Thermoplasmata archaeon]